MLIPGRWTNAPQLELGLEPGQRPEAAAPSAGHPPASTRAASGGESARLLESLRRAGLRGIEHLHLTNNATVLVSCRGNELRLQRAYADAPADVLNAVVEFVNGRGPARRRARRVLLSHPVTAPSRAFRRREAPHPDDEGMATRLREVHVRFNRDRFGGLLKEVPVRVSRRMRSRLGHFRPPGSDGGPEEIAISRRHIRRHGWAAAEETLLHEMVHQWQHENGMTLDHGPEFRSMARKVGTR